MAFTLGEYQDIFLEEADEQLQELNQNLLELEKNPDNIEIINDIFRTAHSLKSSAAFVGLNDLSNLAHKMENLLQGIRDETLMVTEEIIDIIFTCFDAINSVIDTIAGGEEPTQDLSGIIEDIQAISSSSVPEKKKTKKSQTASQDGGISDVSNVSSNVKLVNEDKKKIKIAIDKGSFCYEVSINISKIAQMKWIKAQLVVSNLSRIGKVVKTFPSMEDLDDENLNLFKVIVLTKSMFDKVVKVCDIDLITKIEVRGITLASRDGRVFLKFGDILSSKDNIGEEETTFGAPVEDKEEEENVEIEITDDDADDDVLFQSDSEVDLMKSKRQMNKKVDQEKVRGSVSRTVKVSIDKLDELLNNVGELVIANSGFYKLYEEIRKEDSAANSIANEFKNRMEQMSRIAKDLQTGIMKTRMVQIGQIFSRFNRLIRDLAKEFNKNIELNIKGEDTELDKKVIDAIGEPLLHLIRNSVDHGIETVEERIRLGKTEVAHVTLNAYQGGNQIFVEVSDDGAGLDADQIAKKAMANNLVTPEVLANMDVSDIYSFIFLPGFSTAQEVTDLSGRGVGMNVVKEIVTELNGTVSIETEKGMGTRFVLTFPLTLAIIPAIMIKVCGDTFAIPLSDVTETIKMSLSEVTTIEGHEVINLRGEILSLLRLNDFVGLESEFDPNEKIPVVVVSYGNRKIGLIVDQLEGKLEIVIKSLEQNYKTVEGLAGASILGDGSISLILDVAAMINKVINDQDKHIKTRNLKAKNVKQVTVEKIEVKQAIIKDPKEEKFKVAPQVAIETKEEKIELEPVDDAVAEIKPIEKIEEKEEEKIIIEESPVVESLKEEIKEEKPVREIKTKEKIQDISKETDADLNKKVAGALDDFKKELKSSVQSIMESAPEGKMESFLNLTREDINEFQLIANIGATNAAESLSKILSKRIDLSIPDVVVKPTEEIPGYIGNIDNTYMGVMMSMGGDIKGSILLILHEDVGFELIDMLYGSNVAEKKELGEEGKSALSEVTNIIGTSVINVFSEKTGMSIKPDVPTIVHDYLGSIIDSILIVNNLSNDYAIVMDTEFFFEDDKVIGSLMLFPEAESFKLLIEGLKQNA